MHALRFSPWLITVAACALAAAHVRAQDAPPVPADEAAPAPDEAAPAPDETASAPEAPTTAETPAVQPAPAEQTKEQAPPSPPPPQYVPPHTYEGQVSGNSSDDGSYESGDYAPQEPGQDAERGGGGRFEPPPFSIRLDPFNWLLQGRLPLELEVGVWKLISVELVPEFVTSSSPPLRDFSSYEDAVNQYSNGLGPLSGTSLGVGFWLDGEPFDGYVIRATLTNYGYKYKAFDEAGVIDRVTRTTRRFGGFVGSYRRWGFFTIGGGIGLSYELHQQERCKLTHTTLAGGDVIITGVESGCHGERQIAVDRNLRAVDDTNGFLFPFYLDARFSLGVVID